MSRKKASVEYSYKFRSGFERKVYDGATKNGLELDFERPDSVLSYTRPSRYLPDFVLPNGVLVECKGQFTSADRTKMLLVRKANPLADIRLVFQRANNRLTKSANSITYGEWADRHGFPWSQGSIPEEWWIN